jgi:hypothetical protein
MTDETCAVEKVVQEFYGQSMTEDEGFIAPDFFAMAREILNLRAERDALRKDNAVLSEEIHIQLMELGMKRIGDHMSKYFRADDEGDAADVQEYDKVVNENLELTHQIHELQLQVGDWKDAAEQTIAAARGTMIDAAGERQLRQLVDSVIAYQKENSQLFEVNEQLADVIENFIAAQGTSKEDDAYTALCAYPRVIYEL